MNPAQEDELLALEAIFPSAVSSTSTSAYTLVKITLDTIELGELCQFDVWDWTAEDEAEREARRADGQSSGVTEGTPKVEAPPPASVPPIEATPAARSASRRSRHRHRGAGKRPEAGSSPAAVPPRTAPVALRAAPPPAAVVLVIGSTPSSPPRFHLLPAPVEPPPTTPEPEPTRPRTEKVARRVTMRYLPPLELVVKLPKGYPEDEAPEVELKDGVGWMEEGWRATLLERMRGVWMGGECLWMIVDLLQGDGLVDALELKFPLVLRQAPPENVLASTTTPRLSSLLLEHNRRSSSSAFHSENFHCGICLEAKKGRRCVRLDSCSHVFCLPCLVSYFTLLITEGLVRSVHCPDTACVRARAAFAKAHPPPAGQREKVHDLTRPGEVGREELEGIVGDELCKRWEWVSEKVRIESDPAMAFCPRDKCQAPVPRQDDDEKLRVCGTCSYAFCVFCKKGWHGTQTPCALPQSSAIVSRYLSGTPAEKAKLELRYGGANLRRLVAICEEERVNREYMEANSTPCPGCRVQIEKSMGCSHMHCVRCQTHFCFRCGERLSHLNPYVHYSTPSLPCYNKLFDFVPGNEPPPEEWLDIIGLDA